ncbi:hypothetical protein AMECASPLE_016202 [Ameca splendens]|uniref:Uncharacterized protein n=1 Tax=Ameca splendens TaxID=208324 RepID=A0ABV0ZAW9_9TELE
MFAQNIFCKKYRNRITSFNAFCKKIQTLMRPAYNYAPSSNNSVKNDKVQDTMWKLLNLDSEVGSSFSSQLTCLTSSLNKASASSQPDKASMQHMSRLCFRSSLMSQ